MQISLHNQFLNMKATEKCSNMAFEKTAAYRKSVDISYDDAAKAFDLLPATVFTQGSKFYPVQSFKRAPDWPRAIKLIPCGRALLDSTSGANVHQKNHGPHESMGS